MPTYIFHHITAFTFSFAELPVQPQLMKEKKKDTNTMNGHLLHSQTDTKTRTQMHKQRKSSLQCQGNSREGLSGLAGVKLWPDTLKSFLYTFARLLAVICCCETKQN